MQQLLPLMLLKLVQLVVQFWGLLIQVEVVELWTVLVLFWVQLIIGSDLP